LRLRCLDGSAEHCAVASQHGTCPVVYCDGAFLLTAAIIVQAENCFQNAWAAGDRMAGLVCFNWRVPLQGDWRNDHFGHIAGLTKPAVLGAIIAGLARGLPSFGAFFHRNPMFND
jgi:hypothetical protein